MSEGTPVTGQPHPAKHPGTRRRWWLAAATVALIASIVGISAAVSGSDTEPGSATATGASPDRALTVEYVNFDGTATTLEGYVGEPLVVNFFASWCAPCLAELPEFEAVARSLDGRVRFVGLNLQDQPETGLAVVEQTGITYDVARDPSGSVFTAFEALGMPTTVFIDAHGQVRRVWSGELTGEALAELIDELLL